MSITSIDTIAVVVSDRRKALQWYAEVLGLPTAYIGPAEPNKDPAVQGTVDNPGHWLELGPSRPLSRIHICEFGNHQTEPGPTGITLLTDDIQALYSRLKSRGVSFNHAPQKMDWGEWLCSFTEPDGNEFVLQHPIK